MNIIGVDINSLYNKIISLHVCLNIQACANWIIKEIVKCSVEHWKCKPLV